MADEKLCAYRVSDPDEARFIGALSAGLTNGCLVIVQDDPPVLAGEVESKQVPDALDAD